MTAGGMITFGVTAAVSLLFAIIGITQIRKTVPVTFYSGEEPPKPEEISDVRAYNTGHGVMWIACGAVLILGWYFAKISEQPLFWFAFIIAPLLLMPLYHSHLERKYRINKKQVPSGSSERGQ